MAAALCVYCRFKLRQLCKAYANIPGPRQRQKMAGLISLQQTLPRNPIAHRQSKESCRIPALGHLLVLCKLTLTALIFPRCNKTVRTVANVLYASKCKA